MIGKKIYRLTNVELYDVITNGSDQFSHQDLRLEWEARKLTSEQESDIEIDYQLYKKLQQVRLEKSLTTKEYLTLFVFPFFTPKPRWRNDHLSQSEFERYRMYGFDKKHEQAVKVKQFGMLFWFVVLVVFFLVHSFFNRWFPNPDSDRLKGLNDVQKIRFLRLFKLFLRDFYISTSLSFIVLIL